MNRIHFLKNVAYLIALSLCITTVRAQESSIIPLPKQVQMQTGYFALSPKTRISYDKELKTEAVYLQRLLKSEHKLSLNIVEKKGTPSDEKNIVLVIDENSNATLSKEAYTL